MKAVLSQTIFCGGAHIHGKVGGRILADMDSNGWPQSGRSRALAEIRRVLKKDGLLFAHPGLYYGALGNHLGEFFDDPFIHLKLPPEELRRRVLEKEPERMDRAGHIATPEEYWQWYTELNRITVAGFEMELRDLGFEPWRVAVRSSDLVEYTPEMQGYPMQDLATAELYLSAWNRKL